jgi:hypothetical protein
MIRTRTVGIAFATAIVAAGAVTAFRFSTQRSQQSPPADLVLRGGRLVTLDDNAPEAQALAARNSRIVAIGSNADIAGYIGSSTQVIEINGQFAMPGFIEGHGHFTGIGENKITIDLISTTSWDQIVHMVARAVENAYALPPPQPLAVARRHLDAPGLMRSRAGAPSDFRSRLLRSLRRSDLVSCG